MRTSTSRHMVPPSSPQAVLNRRPISSQHSQYSGFGVNPPVLFVLGFPATHPLNGVFSLMLLVPLTLSVSIFEPPANIELAHSTFGFWGSNHQPRLELSIPASHHLTMVSTPPHTLPLRSPAVICNSQAISSACAQCPAFGVKIPASTHSLNPCLRLSSHFTCSIPYASRTSPVYTFQPPINSECIAHDIQFFVSKPPPLLVL